MKDQQKTIEKFVEEVKASNILEQMYFDAANEAHYFIGLDKKLVFVSPAFNKITGYTDLELYEKGLILFVHPADQKRILKLWNSVYDGELFEDVEYRIVTKDGDTRWCSSTWKVLRDEEGREIGIHGQLKDITKYKKLEEQLKESEQRNRNLLEAAGYRDVEEALQEEKYKAQRYLDTVDAIIVELDMNACIKLINRKGCEVLGYEEQDLLGKNWIETFLPSAKKEEVKKVFNEIINGNASIVEYHENPIIIRDGTERVIAWHNNVMRDNYGKIVGTLGAGEDITERKRAEKQTLDLLIQNRELTQRLFQIQEHERRHIARELHDENSQWLTALRMHAHILADRCKDAEQEVRENIDEIEKISSQIQKSIRLLIRDLRAVDLSKIGLEDSLDELINHWQELYPQTHCEVSISGNYDDLSNPVGVVIYRIVQESLTNVAKHAEAKNVTIQLSRNTNKIGDSDIIKLRIQDDGKGLDHESQSLGFGLAGMRERVLSARGEFEFHGGSKGEGVCIEVQLPTVIKERRKGF